MVEIRFHGRGGQGVVVGCEILAKALLHEGKYVQYSPDFSTERRGAPVRAFLRVSDRQIYQKDQIYNPDCVVLFNSFSRTRDFLSGLKPKGWLIINSAKEPPEFKELGPFRVATVDANEIALKHEIGTQTAPIVNTVMLGAVAKILGVSLDSLGEAIREKFKGGKNYLGALEAYEKVRSTG